MGYKRKDSIASCYTVIFLALVNRLISSDIQNILMRSNLLYFNDNGILILSVDLPTRFCVLYASTGAFYCTAKGVILG